MYIFFAKHDHSFMSSTAITLKYKCACFYTKHVLELTSCSQINLPPLMPDKDNNFSGSLVLDCKNDDVSCNPGI